MAFDQTRTEEHADAVAVRTMVHTVALVAFRNAGIDAEAVNNIGRSLVENGLGFNLTDVSDEDRCGIIAIYNDAVLKLFESVARSLAASGPDQQ